MSLQSVVYLRKMNKCKPASERGCKCRTDTVKANTVSNTKDTPAKSGASSFEFSNINGKVVDTEGNGISGVSVQLYNIDENILLTLCTTKTDGKWSTVEYDAIANYTYLIRYYKTGFEFSDNNIKVIAASGGTTVDDVIATELSIGELICNEDDYTYTVSGEKATIKKHRYQYSNSDSF